ncbi:hypothetical protein TELCIR_22775 [Teladorsagia circumcincta]|uniref:Uncharacterized protein n=1 Tax=Teladorsagia circumcincta TaxID=45464 RepID=A0A2G9TD17_TELCI|nr:hypothetical protein TELCIR_22775 [Teladorsagia circumcincta]
MLKIIINANFLSYLCVCELTMQMDEISSGKRHCKKLLGCYRSKTDNLIPSAVRRAEESWVISKQKRGE